MYNIRMMMSGIQSNPTEYKTAEHNYLQPTKEHGKWACIAKQIHSEWYNERNDIATFENICPRYECENDALEQLTHEQKCINHWTVKPR